MQTVVHRDSQIIDNPRDLLRLELLTSLEKYTKAMFYAQYKRQFVVNEHHRKIFEALQRVLDGKTKRLMINMPPRYSKCCDPSTRVLTPKGLRALGEIQPGERVYSFENGKAVTKTILGKEPAYKDSCVIRMRSGREVICSYDHPWLTTFGYVPANKLFIGDRIQALLTEVDGEVAISDDELIFVTMMIFEGNCTGGNLRFATEDKEVLDRVTESCNNLGIKVVHYNSCESFEYNILGGRSGKATQILEKWGVLNHLAYDKRLPASWFGLSLRQKYMFLDLMFATDGWINTKSGQCGITLANKGLIEDIQYMLASVGILSTFNYEKTKGVGAWTLTVPRQYGIKLLDKLTFYHKRPAALTMLDKKPISLTDTFPYEIIRREKLTYKTRHEGYRCDPKKGITRDKFIRLAEQYPDKLSKYLCDDFYLDEIVSIEPIGPRELVHIEVEDTHNYVANGLVSHNTETVIKSFASAAFALNPKCRFLHLSYSDMLVNDNSDTVRNIMTLPLYEELFPKAALAEKGSSKRWRTKAGGEFYAVSTQGQVTGFGAGNVEMQEDEKVQNGALLNDWFVNSLSEEDMANLEASLDMLDAASNVFQGAILIDDPMKPEDAESDVVRNRINQRFENTIRSRVNSRNTPIIIIMQRLHETDLCGYLMDKEPDEWEVLSLPAIYTDETGREKALWPMKHTLEELYKKRELDPVVFDTQYMQDPTPREGLLYSMGFKTYTQDMLPTGLNAQKRYNYTDTADTGADSLCSICFIDTPEFIYVTDVLFTTADMSVTEKKQAEMLTLNGTVLSLIESNNGGRGYGRNVKGILRRVYKNFKCAITTFTQSQNKKSRIYSNSACVQTDILFPEGWERKWPAFYGALTSYRKDNKKSQHDDAPDCLTGVYEMHIRKAMHKGIKQRN